MAGHVYQRDFTSDKKDWDSVDPYSLFDSETVKLEANYEQRVIRHLEHEAKGADFLVLWLDNDREGENICFEVKDICEPQMNDLGDNSRQVFRAKFSSITKPDI